jgi:hypothetical protein
MRQDQHQFLALVGHCPARLTVEQAAWVLGCQVHDMPVLVSCGLLKPLGNPQPNATKFFCTAEVLELAKNRSWLAKITKTISENWRKKNARKKGHGISDVSRGLPNFG